MNTARKCTRVDLSDAHTYWVGNERCEFGLGEKPGVGVLYDWKVRGGGPLSSDGLRGRVRSLHHNHICI